MKKIYEKNPKKSCRKSTKDKNTISTSEFSEMISKYTIFESGRIISVFNTLELAAHLFCKRLTYLESEKLIFTPITIHLQK